MRYAYMDLVMRCAYSCLLMCKTIRGKFDVESRAGWLCIYNRSSKQRLLAMSVKLRMH
jgi:hypothetical protein